MPGNVAGTADGAATDGGRPRRAGSPSAARRWLFVAPPPRATTLSGWALLPLRLFLGVTFCFAGLQKLANPNFFNANDPGGIQAQLIAAERTSPLHFLLGHLVHVAGPLGVLIALGEVAVGLGTLLGLCTRLAALGGALISLSLFLTVTWSVSPYYTGADLAYLMAWVPLVVAGSGGVLSLDAVIAARARHEAGEGPPNTVPLPFGLVQEICGHYDGGRCGARAGEPCAMHGCPFLREHRPSGIRNPGAVERRTVVLTGAAVAGAGVLGALVAGGDAGIGRAVGAAPELQSSQGSFSSSGSRPTGSASTGGSGSTGTTAGGSARPKGTRLGPAADVPVGGFAHFEDPASGDPGLVIQLEKDQFVAYDAVCPHAGCTVGYSKAAQLIVCPCHGSEFNPNTGGLVQGPATRGLRSIPIAESGGQLYVDG